MYIWCVYYCYCLLLYRVLQYSIYYYEYVYTSAQSNPPRGEIVGETRVVVVNYIIASNHPKSRAKYSESTASSHNSIYRYKNNGNCIISYIILAGHRGEGRRPLGRRLFDVCRSPAALIIITCTILCYSTDRGAHNNITIVLITSVYYRYLHAMTGRGMAPQISTAPLTRVYIYIYII